MSDATLFPLPDPLNTALSATGLDIADFVKKDAELDHPFTKSDGTTVVRERSSSPSIQAKIANSPMTVDGSAAHITSRKVPSSPSTWPVQISLSITGWIHPSPKPK